MNREVFSQNTQSTSLTRPGVFHFGDALVSINVRPIPDRPPKPVLPLESVLRQDIDQKIVDLLVNGVA